MRVLVACKRGNIAPRAKSGHCLCDACLEFRRARWRQKNRDRAEEKKAWLAANPEKQREYSRRWIEKNPNKRRAIEKSWRERNPDRVKEYNAKAGKKWARENRAKRLASVRARQLAKKNRTPPWACRAELLAFYKEAARITEETGIAHEVDHIIPLQGDTVSGLHVPWNLRVIPRSENRRKGNRF